VRRHAFAIATSWNASSLSLYFRALAAELAARGHDVVLLVPNQRHDVVDQTGNPRILTWPSKRPVHLRDARFLWNLTREYRPTCMVANFGAANLMLLVGLARRVRHRIAWYHTVSAAIDANWSRSRFRLAALRFRKQLVLRTATAVVAPSEAARRDAVNSMGVAASRCLVRSHAIRDPFTEQPELERLQSGGELVICVGRLDPNKGQDVLIGAIPLLTDEFPGLQVEFVGDGPSATDLMLLAAQLGVASRCNFTGALHPTEVLRRMRRATVVAVPSRAEAFGVVALEALSVGTPVVASAVGGLSEIVRDGVDGFLVPPSDPGAMASRIAQVLRSPGLKNTLSQGARSEFEQRFDQSIEVPNLATWLESLPS
jgi:glycosyltransferase involved in cell wall biosynthesis